jgi:DNA (cytosine-5)-methyltransferase 1
MQRSEANKTYSLRPPTPKPIRSLRGTPVTSSLSDVQVIDLFAGAGGLGLGAEKAGATLIASIENDPKCCATLRENNRDLFHSVIEADIGLLTTNEIVEKTSLDTKSPLIVVGGAPCQPFSKAAYWTDPGDDARYRKARTNGVRIDKPAPITDPRPDERRTLIEEFYRITTELNADAFLFENVPSILHPRNISTFREFISALREAGYHVTIAKALATSFGVPQARERVFVLGSRRTQPLAPHPTHAGRPNDSRSLPPPPGAGKALKPFTSDEYFEPEEVVTGKWAEELSQIPPGQNYKALTEWAGHPKPKFVAETRFWNFLLKLSPERPSWTLAASPGPWTGPFHWNNRRLRTSEMAALQTFPSDYAFCGSRRDRVRQVGNAVPVLLAKAMFEALVDATLQSKLIESSDELMVAV